MVERLIEQKYEKLQSLLRSYSKVAVAFSGGIDSSLLLFIAGEVLGKDNVLALHGVSCLTNHKDVQEAQSFHNEFCLGKSFYKQVQLHPLKWKEVILNNENRCYFCKKRMYSIFKEELEKWGGNYILDGTNKDDLKDNRPGFRAIRELGVCTPLLEAGLNKTEIRILARSSKLSNHDLPSNSCLATRISLNVVIHEELLTTIAEAENFLGMRGFHGVRVRPKENCVYISVQNSDFERISKRTERMTISHYFRSLGYDLVFLDLLGR